MQFDSIAEIINMNGHGIYVWTVYILGVLTLLINVIRPKMLMTKFYAEQKRMQKLKVSSPESEKQNVLKGD